MTKIQLRRDTSSNWASANPVLASGEPAFETDTGKFKIGDGTTAYNSLPYKGEGSTGVDDYEDLTSKPQINSVTLEGNKTSTDLGLADSSDIEELGNEVNGLAGDITTLDNNKQNKFSTSTPLVLIDTAIPKYTGFNIANNEFTTPSNDINLTYPDSQTSYTTNGSFYYPLPYYIAIPFKNHHTYKVPRGTRIFTGHFQNDGTFYCTGGGMFSSQTINNTKFGPFNQFKQLIANQTFDILAYQNSREKANNTITMNSDDTSCAYFQFICQSNYIAVQCYYNTTAATYVFYNDDLSYSQEDFLDNTDTVLIFPPNVSTYNINQFCDYATTTRIQWNQNGYNDFITNRGENYFSPEGNLLQPELSLNIGEGLSVVDDNLVNSINGAFNPIQLQDTIIGQVPFNWYNDNGEPISPPSGNPNDDYYPFYGTTFQNKDIYFEINLVPHTNEMKLSKVQVCPNGTSGAFWQIGYESGLKFSLGVGSGTQAAFGSDVTLVAGRTYKFTGYLKNDTQTMYVGLIDTSNGEVVSEKTLVHSSCSSANYTNNLMLEFRRVANKDGFTYISNSFRLSTKGLTPNKTISLNYDNSTLKVNGSGQLYAVSSTPSNMVTTDTEQSISGTKTFTSSIKVSDDIVTSEGYRIANGGLGSGTVSLGDTSASLAIYSNGNPTVNNETLLHTGNLKDNLLLALAESGLITNCVISWGTQKPTTDGTTVTIYTGTTIVCPNGFDSSGKPQNTIYTTTSDITVTPTNNLILVAVNTGSTFNCGKFYLRANQSVPADKVANSWLYSKVDNKNYQYANTPVDPTFNQYSYVPVMGLIKSGGTITQLVLNDAPFLGEQLYNVEN